MSIVGVSAAEPPWWVWATWLAAAIVMAAVTGFRRPRAGSGPATSTTPPTATDLRAELRPVPLLAATALLSFLVWIAVLIVYASSVARPPVAADPATTAPASTTLSALDLARLSVISGAVAWLVAVGLLNAGRGIREIGYNLRRIPNGLLAGAIGIFIALPVVFYALQITLWVWQKLDVKHPNQHELLRVIEQDPGGWVRTLAVLAAVVVAPLFEELLFRGCVQGGLRRVTRSAWVSILVASVLFVSLHAAWTMPPLFVFSVLLGMVYERTKNLWATTFMHALFNAFSIVFSGMS